MEEIAKELIQAIREMTAEFQKYNRPVVIVTDNPNCELVYHYESKGYPIYYQNFNGQKEE